MGAQIVIYGPSGSGLTDFERVAPEGVEVGWVDSSLPMEDQAAELRDAQVMIVAGAHVSVEVARHAPNLKLVQTTSAGTDQLDKTALGEMGIRVSNNGGGECGRGRRAYDSSAGFYYPKAPASIQRGQGGGVGGRHPSRLVLAGERNSRKDRGHRGSGQDRVEGRAPTPGLGVRHHIHRCD